MTDIKTQINDLYEAVTETDLDTELDGTMAVELIIELLSRIECYGIREIFMTIWRIDSFFDCLTDDDCLEIFNNILPGSSDLEDGTLIEELYENYGIEMPFKRTDKE